MLMSKRTLIIVLSLVVVGVLIAGLQGILNMLANRGPLNVSGSPQTSSVSPLATPAISGTAPKPATTKPLPTLTTPRTQPKPIPALAFDMALMSDLDSASRSLDISPQGSLPAHVPLFSINGSLGVPYLRSTAASIYKDKQWKYDTALPTPKYNGEKLDPGIEGYARKSLTNIDIIPLSKFAALPMPIPVAQYVNKLTPTFPVSYNAQNRIFTSLSGLPTAYSFESLRYVFDNSTLSMAKASVTDRDLDVPSTIGKQTLDLAHSITGGLDSPYLKAKAIEKYLKDNYSYDYNYERAPGAWDPNEWFLFEEPKGVCTNFNSAFVILARAAGIPARMVGGYYVDPTADSQVVYADQAHAWAEIKLDKVGWTTLDATGSPDWNLVDTATKITQAAPVVDKITTFSVNGTVTADKTTVEGVLVKLYINQIKTLQNATLIGQTLVEGNAFSIDAQIPAAIAVGNYQLIAQSSQTPLFNASISDPAIKVMSGTVLSLSSVPRVKTDQVLSFNGQLAESSKLALAGREVALYLNDQLLTRVNTDSNGNFEYQYTFSKPGLFNIKADYAGNDYYHPSYQTAAVQVLTPTILTFQSSPKIKAGQNLKIDGDLKTSVDKKPVPNQTVELYVDSNPTGIKTRTDTNGHFILEYPMKHSGVFKIETRYTSQPYYWDSSASAAVEVLSANNKTTIGMILMLTGVVIASGYAGLRYLRKHKGLFSHRTKARAVTATDPALDLPQEVAEPVENAPNENSNLELDFPGILPPLPDVWGVSEDFDVACRLTGPDGQPRVAKQIEISMGSPITALTTDEAGKCAVTLSFSEKGFFEVEAGFNPPKEDEPSARAFKVIRIVDYREEIISEYKSLLEWLNQHGVAISQDHTPHEAERLILRAGLSDAQQAVASFIECFEEATYSQHPIVRSNYVKMHFAYEEIKEHEVQPQLSAQ
jgi:transglutaminase-like putative cysteine protease